jgi:hypothetical protein
MLALIVETDASTKAQEAALIQETNINGVLERRLIYAASRSLKSAETTCSKIRRELLVVVFALRKFKPFLKVTHFINWNGSQVFERLSQEVDPAF